VRVPGASYLKWRYRLRSYQSKRDTPHRESVCNAPSTNLYFSVDGQASPCWLYFPSKPPKWSPDRSIKDIWTGPEFTKVRGALADGRFIGRCKTCKHNIATGNRPLAAAYDNPHPIGDWPTMLELELSNLCNLECVMCSGRLSSRIRKYREHLPPLVSPFDDTFVEQVAELLPHLHEIRFNGGEPLMQPLVYKIAERIGEVRPDLKVTIATNGTVINDKVRRLLDRCSIHVNLSLDSLVPHRYEEIRINSDFAKVMENFEVFREYTQRRGHTLCIMVNPMRMNWMEMADYVWWCNERNVHLWFNTIQYPEHVALHNLPADELQTIFDTLAAAPLPTPPKGPAGDIHRNNLEVYERFVHNQVTTWLADARSAAGRDPGLVGVPVELGRRAPAD